MFKIIKIKIQRTTLKVIKDIQKNEDPMILDLRDGKDVELRNAFGRDYLHVLALTNIGTNVVILRSEEKGRDRLTALVKKAKLFDREFVILYQDEAHYDAVRRITSGQSKRGDKGTVRKKQSATS